MSRPTSRPFNTKCVCLATSSLGSTGESVIGKLFGCEVENSSLCRCGKETVRSSLTLLFTMHYPEESSQGESTRALQGYTGDAPSALIQNIIFLFQKKSYRNTTLLIS